MVGVRSLSRIVVGAAVALGVLFLFVVGARLWFSLPVESVAHTQPSVIVDTGGLLRDSPLSRLLLFPTSSSRSIVGVMIENHEHARRQQEGLADALLVGEFLVEGHISRFLVLFDADHFPLRVGPVRSLRPYFVDAFLPWVSGFLFAGGSPEAFDHLSSFPRWHVNGLGFPRHFLRDDSFASPHNLFLPREQFQDLKHGVSLRAYHWPPYPVASISTVYDPALTIRVQFFSPLHNVVYTYDELAETYTRVQGGVMSDARPSNLLFLEMPIFSEGEFGRLDIRPEGEGRLLLSRNGQMIQGRWRKESTEMPFTFVDIEGHPLSLHAGHVWLTALPQLSQVRF